MKYSRIIAGTMTWGKWGKQHSAAEMIALMNHCVENNITTFDHADIYGDYTNEEDFGKAFNKSGIKRENIQLISKCGIQFDVKERSNRVKHYDYDKDYIISSVERSLKMLQTDYLDLLLLHRPSPLMNPSEIAEAVDKLSEDGKIRQFGVSNFTPSQIQLIEKEVQVEANQVEFSLSSNAVMNDGTLDDCITYDRLAMSWSPLGSYFREESKANDRIKKVLVELTKKYDATEDQLLLAWVLKHPSNVHPVVGTATPKRLKMAMEAVAINLELQDWFLMLEANEGHEVA
ncbi:aldo/keto reductase [Maribacter stanieri]|uniref:Predicted oxidoreductase n=1 Tax=Maribacter stanieri TaxID=440514 RepID=A0A1I6HMR5_9FLAO|nr:aldo/keto reductase [Maribacter stanieri]SFR55732.1 Predicted oxidoreductase [Maribacter stanieri]